MFAHAAYCVRTNGCDVVVLQATDTDIFVKAMYYCVRILDLIELWVQKDISRVMRKLTIRFPTWSDTNRAVQLQKMARGLIFRI